MAKSDSESLPSLETGSGSSVGFLRRIRGALFEADAPKPTAVPTSGPAALPRREPHDSLEAAAFEGLSEIVSRETGPALAEFTLQLAAVEHIVPDPATRFRIALSVLEKKGIERARLRAEFEALELCLERQERSFFEKLDARRREQVAATAELESTCAALRENTEREIEALRAAIAAKSEALRCALVDHERKLADARSLAQELTEKEHAFRAARKRMDTQYRTLAAEIQLVMKENADG